MLLLAPLVLDWRGGWRNVWRIRYISTRRAWVWCIMWATVALAYAMPALPVGVKPPFLTGVAYITADLVAAYLIFRKKPSGCAQKTIGVLFGFMASFSIGFFVSSDGSNIEFYRDTLGWLGWGQVACLFAWGAHNVGKTAVIDAWRDRLAHYRARAAR